MPVSVVTIRVFLPNCYSLKQKRSQLQPLIHRLHREFNVSCAEIDLQDKWQESIIECSIVSNDHAYNQKVLSKLLAFMEKFFPDVEICEQKIEALK